MNIYFMIFLSAFADAKIHWQSKPFLRMHLVCTYSDSINKSLNVKMYAKDRIGIIGEASLKVYETKSKKRIKIGHYNLDFVKQIDKPKSLEFNDAKLGLKFIFHGDENSLDGKATYIEKETSNELSCVDQRNPE